ncbi:MAG: PAS domain-containing protein [Desulfobacteraceae bacterium]|nr:MAG: PAS domain-containing protein [Desulfobacteraceae bacterium]
MSGEPKSKTDIILDSIADGVFTVDSDWKITSFNRAAEEITRINRDEAIGRHCWDVFKASICESNCSLRQTMETGVPIVNKNIFILTSEGRRIPVNISTALLKDQGGKVIGGVETFRDLSIVEELRKELKSRHSFFDIISKNSEMIRLFGIMEQVAESDATVLLVGESGTGKELFAKAIHSLSPRRDRPMVTVNCGALPDTLLESELFGYKAGAFTDAKKDKPGRIALAEGGTLFLDEIGDISAALQVRLLRVLQEKIFEPLGATVPFRADVRIVAATNIPLEELVAEGRFRHDLYYRINVVRIKLPPLRERREDVPLLAEHFLRRFSGLNEKSIRSISDGVTAVLMAYDFPGNIRELENIIQYGVVLCRGETLEMEHLPDYLRLREGRSEVAADRSRKGSLGELEKNFLISCLERKNWSRSGAAAELGIHPSTLWRRMKRLGIKGPK